jgi:hydrogenase maturation protease
MTRTLVLGVGNVLLADEGAGVHAMRYLAEHYDLPDTKYIDAGTLSFTLAADIAEADFLVVFDAAQIEAEPGDVKVFEDEEVDEFLKSGRGSVHEVGFADLMDIARLEGYLPRRRALIGIQPEKLGWGEAPSETVRRAMPRAAGNAAALIHKWQRPTHDMAANL